MVNGRQTEQVTSEQIAREVSEGMRYKNGLNLLETVRRNERFYIGEQWDGLKTKTLKPITMNFLRRVCAYFRSVILSDDIGYDIRPFQTGEEDEMVASVYEKSLDRVFERTKLKTGFRVNLRDAIVDGDCVKYFYFDTEIENGQPIKGEIEAENLMNTNVIFGNPFLADVQKQPFLIIRRRLPVAQVRQAAKANGCADWQGIQPESGSEFAQEEDGGTDASAKMTTEDVRFWKQDGRVYMMAVCGKIVTQKAKQTAMTLYPIAFMNWEQRKNSYHGVSPMTEVIATQIAVNRIWTAITVFINSVAFPKLVYDRTRFPNGWDADPSKAVAVSGDVREAVTGVAGGVQLPSAITQILQMILDTTRDLMGVNDAALGNIGQDSSGAAIVALQEASSAPLEMNRQNFYQFVEDCIRILVDLMAGYYGQRTVTVKHKERDPATGLESETEQQVVFDFGAYPLGALEMNVEVGQAKYWSQVVAIKTADALFQNKIITDAEQYLEMLPEQAVPHKAELLRQVREQKKMAAAMPPAAQGGGAVLPPGMGQ